MSPLPPCDHDQCPPSTCVEQLQDGITVMRDRAVDPTVIRVVIEDYAFASFYRERGRIIEAWAIDVLKRAGMPLRAYAWFTINQGVKRGRLSVRRHHVLPAYVYTWRAEGSKR